MKDTGSITGWHAHIYFDAATKPAARALCEAAAERFGVAMGRMHDNPVGPHPTGSCQLSVPPDVFAEIIPWLALNRGELTVFAHAESGAVVTAAAPLTAATLRKLRRFSSSFIAKRTPYCRLPQNTHS